VWAERTRTDQCPCQQCRVMRLREEVSHG
jgi:hypothetical protein